MTTLPTALPTERDAWREDFRCYASQWGYRPGSQVANLIDFLRDEYRAKYGCDYRLRRVGKNRYVALPGFKGGTYGIEYAVAEAAKFNTTVKGDVTRG